MKKFYYILCNFGLNKKVLIWLLFITVVFSLPLITPGIPTGHDLGYHLSRIQGSYELIKNGIFPTLVLPGFYYNLGYPVGIFYPTGLLYIASYLILIGFDTICAYKILLVIISFLTSLSMYISSYGIFKSNKIAYLSTTILTFSIYRGITDLFARGALGEFIAFIFIPLAIWGMYKILNENNASITPLVIGMIGLILTHIISTIVVTILLSCMLILSKKSTFSKHTFKKLFSSISLVTLLTAFYWVPMIEMMISDTFQYQFPWTNLSQNVITDYRQLFYFFINLNIFPFGYEIWWYVVIFVVLIKFNLTFLSNRFISYLLAVFIILFLFTSNLIPVELLGFANFMQFPWRVFIIMSIFGAWLVAYGISLLNSNNKIAFVGVQIFTIIMYLASSFYFLNINMKEYSQTTFIRYSIEYDFAEFLPEGLDMKYLSTLEKKVIASNPIILESKQQLLNYDIYFDQGTYEHSTIILPSLYYKGFKAYLVNDHSAEFLEISKSKNGLISINLDKHKSGKIRVFYNGTLISKYSYIISIITSFCILLSSTVIKRIFKARKI